MEPTLLDIIMETMRFGDIQLIRPDVSSPFYETEVKLLDAQIEGILDQMIEMTIKATGKSGKRVQTGVDMPAEGDSEPTGDSGDGENGNIKSSSGTNPRPRGRRGRGGKGKAQRESQ